MANKWTIFLRKYAKKHGVSYKNAFNSAAAKKEYHKQQENVKKGGVTAKFRGKMYLVKPAPSVKGGSDEVIDLGTGNKAELVYDPVEKQLEEPANVVQAAKGLTGGKSEATSSKTRKRRN